MVGFFGVGTDWKFNGVARVPKMMVGGFPGGGLEASTAVAAGATAIAAGATAAAVVIFVVGRHGREV